MIFVGIFRRCHFAASVFSLGIKSTCQAKFFHSRIFYNMKTAYIQHSIGEEKVHITINFEEFNIRKIFNFDRHILEKLVDFSQKLDHKLSTIWEKKKKKKSDNSEDFEVPQLKSHLLLNNHEVSDSLVFQDLFENNFNGNLKLKISESDYDVIINPPLITSMCLPTTLQVGSIASPENLKSQCTDLKRTEFTWYRSVHPGKLKGWEECGKGFSYFVKENDLGYYLKLECVPKMNNKVGPVFEVKSKTQVEKADNLCEIQKRQEFTKEKTQTNEFRIVSYNILAHFYIHTKEGKSQIFTFCNPLFLEYDYRKSLLNTELHGYNADILCMQEVERKFFHSHLLMFNDWGYEGIYHEKEGSREGCELLYSREKFNLLMTNQYTLTKELLHNSMFSDIKSSIETNKKLMDRLNYISSQLQLAILECYSDNVLIIGNVHLYFHPDADHIRLLQGVVALRILLHELEKFKKQEPDKKVSVLLCGDFNSTPECAIHQLLSQGSVDSSHSDWKSKEDEIIENVSCSHSLKMKSCYDHDIFTNYTPAFKACIDYIYFQSDHLKLVKNVPVPSEGVLSQFGGIPSQFFPSDHVALIADLKFKDN